MSRKPCESRISTKQLVSEISGSTSLAPEIVQIVLGAFVEKIESNIRNGQAVQITGFGTFKHKKGTHREITNVANGEKLEIPPKARLKFVTSRNLLSALNKR